MFYWNENDFVKIKKNFAHINLMQDQCLNERKSITFSRVFIYLLWKKILFCFHERLLSGIFKIESARLGNLKLNHFTSKKVPKLDALDTLHGAWGKNARRPDARWWTHPIFIIESVKTRVRTNFAALPTRRAAARQWTPLKLVPKANALNSFWPISYFILATISSILCKEMLSSAYYRSQTHCYSLRLVVLLLSLTTGANKSRESGKTTRRTRYTWRSPTLAARWWTRPIFIIESVKTRVRTNFAALPTRRADARQWTHL